MATVLVVDDEPEIVEMLLMLLEGDGVAPLGAHDGEEAWDLVRSERPDLVLTDIMMPRMNGVELCRRLREDPSTRSTVVLLMSAARQIDTGGCDAAELLRKPFDIVNLVGTVHRHLGAA